MKIIVLIFSLILSTGVHASNLGNPVSTQNVFGSSGTTINLTCPAGKWCKVLVSINLMCRRTGGGTAANTAATLAYELIIKSSQILSAEITLCQTAGTDGAASVIMRLDSNIVNMHSAHVASPTSGSIQNYVSAGMYSMEYYN